jgi:hypothetical protein
MSPPQRWLVASQDERHADSTGLSTDMRSDSVVRAVIMEGAEAAPSTSGEARHLYLAATRTTASDATVTGRWRPRRRGTKACTVLCFLTFGIEGVGAMPWGRLRRFTADGGPSVN